CLRSRCSAAAAGRVFCRPATTIFSSPIFVRSISPMSAFAYAGNDLDVFAHAINWKRYFGRVLSPYIRGDVLEVGAGIGGTTRVLCTPRADRWVCLEPDPELAERLQTTAIERPFAIPVGVAIGTVASLADDRR